MRSVVNQLVTELDGLASDNEGVCLLAATTSRTTSTRLGADLTPRTAPCWVLPPDVQARESIFRTNPAHRPVEGIDLRTVAAKSDGLCGADIAYVYEPFTERR
jgi:AAA+ superfamily predicted ATPase